MARSNVPNFTDIPDLPPVQEKESKDLTELTYLQLLEIKEREEKLLASKAKLRLLPDKGKRIEVYYQKVLTELKARDRANEAAARLSGLNIVTKGKETLNRMEWKGGLVEEDIDDDPSADLLDSDDEEYQDPLRIIARAQMHKRRVKILPPEKTLITAADLEEIRSFEKEKNSSVAPTDAGLSNNDASDVEVPVINAEMVTIDVNDKLSNIKPKVQQLLGKFPSKESASAGSVGECSGTSTPSTQDVNSDEVHKHVRYVVNKTEAMSEPAREKFKPYKTTVSNVHEPEKERMRKKHKYWEVTAATPPPIQHSGAKLLSLLDSVEIQNNYLRKLKDLQEQQAAARLRAREERMQNIKIHLPSSEDIQNKSIFRDHRGTPNVNHIEGTEHYHDVDEVNDHMDEA